MGQLYLSHTIAQEIHNCINLKFTKLDIIVNFEKNLAPSNIHGVALVLVDKTDAEIVISVLKPFC